MFLITGCCPGLLWGRYVVNGMRLIYLSLKTERFLIPKHLVTGVVDRELWVCACYAVMN